MFETSSILRPDILSVLLLLFLSLASCQSEVERKPAASRSEDSSSARSEAAAILDSIKRQRKSDTASRPGAVKTFQFDITGKYQRGYNPLMPGSEVIQCTSDTLCIYSLSTSADNQTEYRAVLPIVVDIRKDTILTRRTSDQFLLRRSKRDARDFHQYNLAYTDTSDFSAIALDFSIVLQDLVAEMDTTLVRTKESPVSDSVLYFVGSKYVTSFKRRSRGTGKRLEELFFHRTRRQTNLDTIDIRFMESQLSP